MFLSFENKDTSIYQSLSELQILTVDIVAKCSDGIALIADRKYTNIILGKENFDRKVFGNIAHFLILFTGQYIAFDIFRKYVIGDIIISQNDNDITKHYTFIISYPNLLI
jgi:hypothetical protein